MMASNDDVAVLKSIGHDLIKSFVPVVVETFVIGDHILVITHRLDHYLHWYIPPL